MKGRKKRRGRGVKDIEVSERKSGKKAYQGKGMRGALRGKERERGEMIQEKRGQRREVKGKGCKWE